MQQVSTTQEYTTCIDKEAQLEILDYLRRATIEAITKRDAPIKIPITRYNISLSNNSYALINKNYSQNKVNKLISMLEYTYLYIYTML